MSVYVIASRTQERLYVQFWGDAKTVSGIAPVEFASMDTRDTGSPAFLITHFCPAEVMPIAWEAFGSIRRGVLPKATHTIDFIFSKPVFTPTESEETTNG